MIEQFKNDIEAALGKLEHIDITDLNALADLHSLLEETGNKLPDDNQIPDKDRKNARQLLTASSDKIEQILLREVNDASAALNTIKSAVTNLGTWLDLIASGQQDVSLEIPPELDLKNPPCPDPAGTPCQQLELPDNIDEDIFQEFMSNVPDTLTNLETAILAAEKDPNPDNRNAIKAILHNLKGESALMGLEKVSGFCHETESLLQNENEEFPAEKLLAARDWLEKALTGLTVAGQDSAAQPANIHTANAADNNPVCPQPEAAPPAAEPPTDTESAETDKPDDFRIAEGDIPLVMDFINESNEHLESAEGNLLSLEENPNDKEMINAIFRAFHTIKGVAGFLNLQQIGSLAHVTENLLDKVRKDELALEGAPIDVVFEAIDLMKKMLDSLREAVDQGTAVTGNAKVTPLIERIKACLTGETPAPRLGEILVEEGATDRGTIREALQDQEQQQEQQQTPEKIGNILINKQEVTSNQVKTALDKQKRFSESPTKSQRKKAVGESTVKVATGKLDLLINMVGELVVAQSMVSQDLQTILNNNQRLARNERHLNKIMRELQELSMSMRMVPVQGVFQKMARLVRDLSRKGGKEIEFIMDGADTELDRNVVEAIADPLVHMVRNSVDHGIEPPDVRVKNGKNASGKIVLRAFHQGGNIVIEIEDDGRGLNREKILQKAISNGIVKPDQELSDQEIYRLIFHAGLSTAEKITDISGRGVGMDVVRKNIEALRGRIDINSTPGKGSIFTIRLPLTLAVIDGQVVAVGSQKFIIPTLSIVQNLRPSPKQLSTIQEGRGEMLMVRGELLPLVRLHRLFNIPAAITDPCAGIGVVVTNGEHKCCILVDNLIGQQQVVIKTLGEYLGTIRGVTGGAIMGDGNVSLILDVPGIINLKRNSDNFAA